MLKKILCCVSAGVLGVLAPLGALSQSRSLSVPSMWELYVCNHNGEILSTHNLAQKATLHFQAQNALSGSSGCNNFFGSYGVQDATLSFSHMGATRKMCDSKSMYIESLLLGLFSDGSVSYVLERDELILERDSIKAVFKRVR